MADNFLLRKYPFHDPAGHILAQETTVDVSRLRSKFWVSLFSRIQTSGLVNERGLICKSSTGWADLENEMWKGLGLRGEKKYEL